MRIGTRTAARVATAAGLFLAFLVPCSSRADGTWSERNPAPVPISGVHSVAIDGIIYLVGGFSTTTTCSAVNTLWAYDPSTDHWTSRQALPSPRFGVATAAVGGKLYAFGGAAPCGETELSEALSYDPATDQWTALSPVPATSVGSGLNSGSAYVVDGKIYLMGGLRGDPNQAVPDVLVYDPATDTYSWGAPMPVTRYGAFGAAKDGRIYLMSGTPGLTTDLQVYDTTSDTWTAGAPMPEATCCSSGAIVGDRIFALGGASALGHSVSYDILTNTWRSEPDLPVPRYNLSAEVVGGVVYTIGGQTFAAGSPVTTVEAFTPASDAPPNQVPVADAGPDQVLSAGSDCHAEARLDGSRSHDPDGDALSYLWSGSFGSATGVSPTVTLGLGANPISLAVDDGRGASATDATQVTVVDESAPQIVATSVSPSVLLPPDHRMVDVVVNASATDNCGVAQCRIVSVASNEPADGTGDGDTPIDWLVTGNLALQLRAERAGTGNGRVYTLGLECRDSAGNATTSSLQVNVPH